MNANGDLHLPAAIREELGLHDGSTVVLLVEHGHLLVQPLLANSLEELHGIFASDKDLVAELQQERRQDRW